MIARSFQRLLPFSSLFVAAQAFAQAQPAQPAPAPAPAAPAPQAPGQTPTLGERVPESGAPGTGAPVNPAASQTETELERRLEVMRGGVGLTSAEVARRAVQNSYALEAKRASLRAADASVDQAKSQFWPQLLLQARYTRLSDIESPDLAGGGGLVVTPSPTGPIDPNNDPLFSTSFSFPVVLNNYTLQATLNVPISDYLLRMSNAVGSAKYSRTSAELDAKATRLSVAREGRQAYYEWVRTIGQTIVAEQTLEQTQARYTDTENAFKAGMVSRADVLRAEAAVKEAQLTAERVKYQSNLAEIRLRVLMRDTTQNPYSVGENMFADLPELEQVPSPEAAYREALAKRLELKSLEAAEQSLKSQARVARAGNYPRLDAQGNLTYANPNQRYFPQEEVWKATWDASLVLSWTPTDIPGAQAQSAVAEARAAELHAQRKAFEDSLKIEVNQALEAVNEMRFAIGVTQHALAAAEESYRVRQELFRAGRATLVELTDAQTELTRARIEVVNARVNSRLALVALNYALGRDTLTP
jgi:outer membrane protein